jgi:hypothetical protein
MSKKNKPIIINKIKVNLLKLNTIMQIKNKNYIECPNPIVKITINTKNGIIFFKIFSKINIYNATSANNRNRKSLRTNNKL